MNLTIRVDARSALGYFNSLSRQVPFAASKAVNNLAVLGQRRVQAGLGERFTLRRRTFVERTVKMLRWANKRMLVATVAIDPRRDFLAKFEAGGVKKPQGNFLTVPVAVRRNKSDIIVKSMRVRELQLRAQRTSSGAVQLKGKHRTFALKGTTGGMILQRVGRRSRGAATLAQEIAAGRVRVLYAFKRSVPIPASLRFQSTFADSAKEWPRVFEAAWEQALATARR